MGTLKVVQDALFWFWSVELLSVGRHRALEFHGSWGPGILARLGFLNLKQNLNLKLGGRGLKLALGGAVPKPSLAAAFCSSLEPCVGRAFWSCGDLKPGLWVRRRR